MDIEREAAAATDSRPALPNRNDPDRLDAKITFGRSERLKRRKSGLLEPDGEALQGRHKLAKTEQPNELCENCIELAKWLSEPGIRGKFNHCLAAQLRTTALSCSLCQMIVTVVDRRKLLRKDDRVWFGYQITDYQIVGIMLWVDTRNPQEFLGEYWLATHTDEASSEGVISTIPPLPMEPCLETYNQVKSWLSDCVQNHHECRKTMGDQLVNDVAGMVKLPKRVIDVGRMGQQRVRLVETLAGLGQYCALSHCWGSEKPLMTTSKTLDHHLAGINMQDLPKTFREAVEITRGIGIRYLWIDSLCIIQGDEQDWHQQAEHMAMIYGRAYMTIAASGASDSTKGCFLPEDVNIPAARLPLYVNDSVAGQVYLSQIRPYEDCDPYSGPLRARAWAMQEWNLSRRVLHCTKGGLVWKCKRCYLNERNVNLGSNVNDANWDEMIGTYTRSMLTIPTDRLIALRGTINAIQQSRSDRNHFGMWAGDMPAGLLWSVENPRKGMTGMYDAPSWSWAAKDGSKFMLRVWASKARERQGRDSWIQSNITRAIAFAGPDARAIALEGFLLPCLGQDLLVPHSGFYGRTPSPERSSVLCERTLGGRVYSLRQREEKSVSNCVGIAAMDDSEALHSDDMSLVFCAYMVAGERTVDDPCLVKNRVPYHDESGDAHDAHTCKLCLMFSTSRGKTFYWVLVLKAISEGGNRFKRIGMGIVWPEPSGPMQKYYIE